LCHSIKATISRSCAVKLPILALSESRIALDDAVVRRPANAEVTIGRDNQVSPALNSPDGANQNLGGLRLIDNACGAGRHRALNVFFSRDTGEHDGLGFAGSEKFLEEIRSRLLPQLEVDYKQIRTFAVLRFRTLPACPQPLQPLQYRVATPGAV